MALAELLAALERGFPPYLEASDHGGYWGTADRDGNDEMDPAQGRGWAVIDGDELRGTIFFHGGDDSAFQAVRKGR